MAEKTQALIHGASVVKTHWEKRQYLKSKGAKFTEFDINVNPEKRGEMLSRANGKRTVPQIFIDSFHIGGCDELYNLEHGGNLDGLLSKT